MINLHELLGIEEQEFLKYKVHFATGSKDKRKPYNAFLIDEFKGWQERQTNKNFGREFVLSLIYYDKDVWMFGGIYRVLPTDPLPISENGWIGWKQGWSDTQHDINERYEHRNFNKWTDCAGKSLARGSTESGN